MAKMHFAKMNINEDIFQIYDGEKRLNEILKKIFANISASTEIYDEYGGRIKFFDLDISETGYKITGNLGYIKKGVHSSYDPEKDTAISTTDNNKIEYIAFYFDVENELLGYMTLPVLSRKKVLQYFSKLIKKESNIGVEFIIEQNIDDIKTELKKYEKISGLSVRMLPPNGDQDDYDKLFSIGQDELKESNATKVTQKYQTQRKEGINKHSRLMKKFIYGLSLGYAEIKLLGRSKSGERLSFSSSSKAPYVRNVPYSSSKDHIRIKETGRAGIEAILEHHTRIRIHSNKK